jgi:homopolymeric O-antigen transport system ATP-binding protein
VRLAFAVAAFLETEILLVDEVLAVGDSRFQRKCLGKMEDLSGQGRTVLFVSHSMPTITRLCKRALLLHEGKLIVDGSAPDVAARYLSADIGGNAHRVWDDPARAPGDNIARLRSVRVINKDGQTAGNIDIRQPVGIELEYDVLRAGLNIFPETVFQNGDGIHLFVSPDNDAQWIEKPRPVGHYRSVCWIPGNFLAEGLLSVTVNMRRPDFHMAHVNARDAVSFYVVDPMEPGAVRVNYAGSMKGLIRPMLDWETALTKPAKKR